MYVYVYICVYDALFSASNSLQLGMVVTKGSPAVLYNADDLFSKLMSLSY